MFFRTGEFARMLSVEKSVLILSLIHICDRYCAGRLHGAALGDRFHERPYGRTLL